MMEVFEIEWRVMETAEEGGEPKPATKNAFANTKTEAMREVGAIAVAGLNLDGEPTVYKCELDVPAGHVATIFALLNNDIKPVRKAIVHGQLPLPMQG